MSFAACLRSGERSYGLPMQAMTHDSTNTNRLLESVDQGDQRSLERLLAQHREFLRRLLELRIEPALRGRFDASDVIQETLLVASQRIDDFLTRRPTSFRLWLRRKALERLIDLRRAHEAQKRDVAREVPLTDVSSLAIARYLLSGGPSGPLRQRELAEVVRQAIAELREIDCEVLLLRHAE